jgi:hypothetical protein
MTCQRHGQRGTVPKCKTARPGLSQHALSRRTRPAPISAISPFNKVGPTHQHGDQVRLEVREQPPTGARQVDALHRVQAAVV